MMNPIHGRLCFHNMKLLAVCTRSAPSSSQLSRSDVLPSFRYVFFAFWPTTVQSNVLYQVYSLPNVILPLFGGLLLDRFGVRRITLLLSIIVCVGQAVFAVGTSLQVIHLRLYGICSRKHHVRSGKHPERRCRLHSGI